MEHIDFKKLANQIMFDLDAQEQAELKEEFNNRKAQWDTQKEALGNVAAVKMGHVHVPKVVKS